MGYSASVTTETILTFTFSAASDPHRHVRVVTFATKNVVCEGLSHFQYGAEPILQKGAETFRSFCIYK